MSRSSYLYQAPNQGIGQASYNNRMAKERGEAQQRLQSRDNAYDFGPAQPERSQLARMADQATVGQPVNLNEAERLQKAALDRQLIDQGLRQKSIDEAIGAPGPRLDALSRGSPGGYKASFAPKEKTQWDPFNNPEMKGMTGMEKRAARFADGGLFKMPMPAYAMGGPVTRNYAPGGPGTRDYGMGGPGLRGYAMGGLVKGGLGQAMPNGRFMTPQMLAPGYADGGPVEGPGGPKDDLINAKLSDGEFVMPAEAVEFYGLDRLTKMMTKAKEGLAEIKPAPQAPRSLQSPQLMPMMMGNPMGQPQPTPGFAYGGPVMRDSLPGYAEGGPKRRYLFDSGAATDAGMEAVPAAINAQQAAVEANQNPSFLDYYFPEAGVQASEQASSATQEATDALGRFFENEAAATAADRMRMAETRQRQDAMMNYQPGSPAPRPAPGPLPEYGSAAPLFPRGRPAEPSPATAMMAPAVSPSPSPQVPFVADPATEAAMRSRRADIRAGQPLLTAPEGLLAQGRAVLDSLPPAPAMANGRQPQPVISSPMETPMMRPAPLTMTEKERLAMPLSRSRTPEANPDFEAALAGLTGMQKRRARQGLQMEEANFQRNQGRADAAQAVIDARNEQIRLQNLQDQRDNMVIADQFRQAAENRNIGTTAALNAAKDKEAEDAKRKPVQAVPIVNADGTVSQTHHYVNGMVLPIQTEEPKTLKVEPGVARALLSSPQAGTLDAATLAEISADTRYDLATRELARRQLAKASPPETGRVVMSGGKAVVLNKDGTYQDATDLDATTAEEKKAAFRAAFGRDPGQTSEEDWRQAYSLAREAKQKARTSPTAAPASQIPTFASEDEATRAGYKGLAIIGGRRAQID